MRRALLFDFDGVVADSEPLANRVLADLLTECGAPTTLEQSYARYVGKQPPEIVTAAAEIHGLDLPADFAGRLLARTLVSFATDLRPVAGFAEFADAFRTAPRAVASSSTPERLAASITALGLEDYFGTHVYSAAMVRRGKPAPDVYLLAAERIGMPADACVVLEDSPSGVRAGVAAGMTVVGLLAGGHIGAGHGERLAAAGAAYVAPDYAAARRYIAAMGGWN